MSAPGLLEHFKATDVQRTVMIVTCDYFSADDVFESVGDRELRQVFEGQNRIHLEIKQLNRQLDMILDEQRRYVSSLTEEISRRGAGTPGQPGQVRVPSKCSSQNSTVLS